MMAHWCTSDETRRTIAGSGSVIGGDVVRRLCRQLERTRLWALIRYQVFPKTTLTSYIIFSYYDMFFLQDFFLANIFTWYDISLFGVLVRFDNHGFYQHIPSQCVGKMVDSVMESLVLTGRRWTYMVLAQHNIILFLGSSWYPSLSASRTPMSLWTLVYYLY